MQKNLGIAWLFLVGGFGFLAGFFGPMIFAPEANQGPMLGIFITGPIGFLLGAACWIFSSIGKWTYKVQKTVAAACCALIALGILISVLLPKPEWVGRIYEIEVAACSPSATAGESVLEAVVLKEKVVSKEKPPFKPEAYRFGELTWKGVQKHSFYIPGTCLEFPVGYKGVYFVSSRGGRDKAVLEPLPDFVTREKTP